MMIWEDNVRTIKTMSIKIGNAVATLNPRGPCKDGCTKWILSLPPFIMMREIEVEGEEEAKAAALAIIKTELSILLSNLPE
jgi:hypothetical protein